MTVTNVLKDGTVVDDMSKVAVPKEIVEQIAAIIMESRKSGNSVRKEGDSK